MVLEGWAFGSGHFGGSRWCEAFRGAGGSCSYWLLVKMDEEVEVEGGLLSWLSIGAVCMKLVVQ